MEICIYKSTKGPQNGKYGCKYKILVFLKFEVFLKIIKMFKTMLIINCRVYNQKSCTSKIYDINIQKSVGGNGNSPYYCKIPTVDVRWYVTWIWNLVC